MNNLILQRKKNEHDQMMLQSQNTKHYMTTEGSNLEHKQTKATIYMQSYIVYNQWSQHNVS